MRIQRLGVLALALALALTGCAAQSASDTPELLEPVGVDLDFAEASYMDLYTIKQYAFAVVPHVEEMRFTVDGTVETVDAYLGKRVREGEALVTLDESALIERQSEISGQIAYYEALDESQLRSARIDIDIAELEYARLRANGASQAELAKSRADIDMRELLLSQDRETRSERLAEMRAELAQVEAKLGKNVLRAPFDGTVVWIDSIRAEDGVQAYETVVKLADDSRVSLSGEYLSESVVSAAREVYALIGGARYEIEYEPIDMTEYFSTVFAGGTAQARFSFATPPEGVSCGDYAAVCLKTGYAEQALAIPSNAMYVDDIGKYVYRLEDGARVRVSIKTGVNNGLYVQITEGLKEGDRVYVKE